MYTTFANLETESTYVWLFSEIYLYSFTCLFIYLIASLVIALIIDGYDTVKVSRTDEGRDIIKRGFDLEILY